MLNPQMQTQNRLNGENLLSASQPKTQNAQKQQMDKMVLDRTLRKKRSKEYMQAIQKLDAGGHTHNQKQVDEIIGEITNEFPEVKLEGLLIGFVAICYLGKPYEVHTLDLSGRIIQHFQEGVKLRRKSGKSCKSFTLTPSFFWLCQQASRQSLYPYELSGKRPTDLPRHLLSLEVQTDGGLCNQFCKLKLH